MTAPVLVERAWSRLTEGRRARVVDQGLAAWLDAAGRAARSGASLRQALADGMASVDGEPVGVYLAPVAASLAGGGSLDEAFDVLGSSATTAPRRLVLRALVLARRAGGPVAPMLDAVAATLHERAALAREARALATQARASAAVMVLAPIAFAVVTVAADPGVGAFMRSPAGVGCVAAGVALDVLGAWWMARIVRVAGVMFEVLAAVAVLGSMLAIVTASWRTPPPRPVRELVTRRPNNPTRAARRGGVVMLLGRGVRRLARRPPDAAADQRVGLAIVLGAAGAVVHPLAGAIAAASPAAAHVVRRRQAAQRAADALLVEVPDVVDLFRVAVGGGLTVHQAVVHISDVVDDDSATGPALDEVRRRVLLGERLADALATLGRLGEPVRPLVAALVSAEREGAPLAGPLTRAADQARDLRRRRAEEIARRVPVRLLFPLVLCVLPAFTLLTVVPLLASTLRTLSL